MSDKAKSICQEFEALDAKRSTIMTDFQRVATFVNPSHAYFTEDKWTDGNQDKHVKVYDTTAMRASEVLASFFHGAVCPPTTKWFKLGVRNKEKANTQASKEYFEEQERKMFEAIQESNFVTSVAQFFLDYGTFCTAAMSCFDESDSLAFGRLKFTNLHLKSVVFKEGVTGKPEYIFIKVRMAAVLAAQMYPDGDMPKVMDDANSDKNRFKEHDFITACEPIIENGSDIVGYKSEVVSVSDKTIVTDREDITIPYFIARFQQATGQVWGTGPGMRALPDIMTVNRAKELELGGWEEDVNGGFLTTPDNVVSDDIDRRGVTEVRDISQFRSLREGQTQWNVAQIKGEEIQNSIRSMFYEDRLVMPSSSGDTATEFRIRYDLLQRQLAPAMGRLQTEFLNPLIERIFDIMINGGALDPLPEDLAGEDLDIEYLSPIAKAQRMPEIDSIQQWLSLIGGLVEIYPQVRHLADVEKALRDAADILGVPANAVRSEDEYAKEVEKEQQMIQAQREAEANAQNQGQQV